MDEKIQRMAEGFLHRASNKLNEAREQLEKGWSHCAESISASQECIELSAKATFLLLQDEYPKKHQFTEEEFEGILSRIPADLAHYNNFPRLYLLHQFWSHFYTLAKYGYEKLGVPAKDLFEKEEAELAVHHADRWYYAARALFNKLVYG